MEQPYDDLRRPLQKGIISTLMDYMVSRAGYRLGLCFILLIGNLLVTDLWREGKYIMEIMDNVTFIFYCIECGVLATVFITEEIFILLKAIWGKLLFFLFIMFMKRAALGLYRSTDMMVKYVDDMSIVLHDVKENYTNYHYTKILSRLNMQFNANTSLKEHVSFLSQQIKGLEKVVDAMESELDKDYEAMKDHFFDETGKSRGLYKGKKAKPDGTKVEDANVQTGEAAANAPEKCKPKMRDASTQNKFCYMEAVNSLQEIHDRVSNIQAVHNRIQCELAEAVKRATPPKTSESETEASETKEKPSDNNYVEISQINITKCLLPILDQLPLMSGLKDTDFHEFPGETPISALIPEEIYSSVELNVKSDNVEMNNVEVKYDKVEVDEENVNFDKAKTKSPSADEDKTTKNIFVSAAYWQSEDSSTIYSEQMTRGSIFTEDEPLGSNISNYSIPYMMDTTDSEIVTVAESVSSVWSDISIKPVVSSSTSKTLTPPASSAQDDEESQPSTSPMRPKTPKGAGDFCKKPKVTNYVNVPQSIVEIESDEDNSEVIMGVVNPINVIEEREPDHIELVT